jgi:hypothetical protein
MIDPAQRCDFVRRVGEIENRAVFEIPDILERILAGGAGRGAAL